MKHTPFLKPWERGLIYLVLVMLTVALYATLLSGIVHAGGAL